MNYEDDYDDHDLCGSCGERIEDCNDLREKDEQR